MTVYSLTIKVYFVLDLAGCNMEKLPNVSHGHLRPNNSKKFKGMVFQCSCDIGFRRMGSALVYCNKGEWSPKEFPVCTSKVSFSKQCQYFLVYKLFPELYFG